MRGRIAIWRFNPEGQKQGREDFERALKLDPSLVIAKVALAHTYADGVIFFTSKNPRADAEQAERLANEALAAEPDNAFAHDLKAEVYQALVLTRGAAPSGPLWQAGLNEADAAISLDRNLADAYAKSGWYRLFLGRAEDAFAGVETAMRISPRDPIFAFWKYYICHLYSHLGQWEQAIEYCRRSAEELPNVWYPQLDVVLVNGWLGRDAEAKAASATLLKLYPGFTAKTMIDAGKLFSDNPVYTQQIARMAEGLRKAGLPRIEPILACARFVVESPTP